MSKLSVFEDELNLIKRDDIREFTKYALLNLVPDYFFEIPASSTGKYHPSYSQGQGGLVRHSKALVRIGVSMAGANELFHLTSDELDMFISSGILHDGFKSGFNWSNNGYTVHDHPIIMGNEILNNGKLSSMLDKETLHGIVNAIKSHMGQWNTNNYSNVELPKPKTKLEHFLHLADYLASRKCIEINFDALVSRPN